MIWLAMAALAVACAAHFEFQLALLTWSAGTSVLCAMSALLISRQPLGVATLGGRFGSAVVHWGFRASHGRLLPAAVISWLIWLIIGGTAIAGVHFTTHLPIFVAWAGDLLGLFYILGVMLVNRGGRISASLAKLLAALLAMIAGSVMLWFHNGSDQARAIALAVAGGPPLVTAAVYGFVLATGLLSGRFRHR